MKFRRLKIEAHPEGIAFSLVTDQESGDMIAGVASITWSTDGADTGDSLVILKLWARDVDFSVRERPAEGG